MSLIPGMDPPRFRALLTIEGGHPRNVTEICMGEHVGTHVDSPRHVSDGAAGIDEVPLELLWGEVLVVDLAHVDLADVADFEALGIPDGTRRLFIKSSHSAVWAGGGEDKGNDHPTFTVEAAQWLVDRGVRLLGVDTCAVGRGPEGRTRVHETLLKNGVIIAEALNLHEVPPGKYEVACLPLKIAGADGGPARVALRGPIG
jgi:arylformamidase